MMGFRYFTKITLSNGNEYRVEEHPKKVLSNINQLIANSEVFWEVDLDKFIKISDISSVELMKHKLEVID